VGSNRAYMSYLTDCANHAVRSNKKCAAMSLRFDYFRVRAVYVIIIFISSNVCRKIITKQKVMHISAK